MGTLKHPLVVFVVAVLVVIGGGVGVVVATGTAGLRTVTPVACVPDQSAFVPVSPRWDRVSTSGAVHLKRGMFVGLQVFEGGFAVPKGAPAVIHSFPWTTPVVSGNGVLSATRECGHPAEVSSGTIAVYWFQAVAAGRVTVTVPLTKAWVQAPRKSLLPKAQPLRVNVTVG